MFDTYLSELVHTTRVLFWKFILLLKKKDIARRISSVQIQFIISNSIIDLFKNIR